MSGIEGNGIVDTDGAVASSGGPAVAGLAEPGVPGAAEAQVDIGCVVEAVPGRASERTSDVALQFGVPLASTRTVVIGPTRIMLAPGRLVLIVGPSGSGKSSALAAIARQVPNALVVDDIRFPTDAAVVDRVAPWAPLGDALCFMTACGLSEPRLWIRRFAELSEGEKFRARLARGVALASRTPGVAPLLCDEFGARFHRRLARAVSLNLRKLIARRNLCAVVASCQEDVIADLQPDVIVRLYGDGRTDVEAGEMRADPAAALHRRLRIEPGSKRDFAAFAGMHYRHAGELGFVDKVFVLRERGGEESPLGIVVYAYSPLELILRNEATGRRFCGDPAGLNASCRMLRRLVIHPDVRGCGLGHYLVRKTLPLVGTEFVECIAAMGAFNPVFEKAGMERVGRCEIARARCVALEKLREMDVDPLGRDFPVAVARSRRVREIVAGIVFRWYAATTGGGDERVVRQSPETLARTFRSLIASRPVYYLWRKPARLRRRFVVRRSQSKSSHPEIHPSNTRRERDVECAPDGRPTVRNAKSSRSASPSKVKTRRIKARTSKRRKNDPQRLHLRGSEIEGMSLIKAEHKPKVTKRKQAHGTRHDPRRPFSNLDAD